MQQSIPITNRTAELSDCRGQWFFDEQYQCWCLEDILYTQKATTPKFQRLSIFVPKPYLKADGTPDPDGRMGSFTACTAPVIFENNSAGYMQMPHTWLGGPRDEAGKYLERGMVYVTCGCRGRESRDQDGNLCGKSPWALVDLKTAIRFLRHNSRALPGDFNRIVSVGWSAGGAMSSLVGLTGNNDRYLPFLEQNGAFLEETDDVYAAQIYCPIVDLEHADLAYEWQFLHDPENEDSPAGPSGRMTPFQAALSGKLADAYVRYFNGLGLTDPSCGETLFFGEDGRSGSAYDCLMKLLEDSVSDYLTRLSEGRLPESYSPEDYIEGRYMRLAPAPKPDKKPRNILQGHAGPGVALPDPAPDFENGPKPGEGHAFEKAPGTGEEPAFREAPGAAPADEGPALPPARPSLGDLVSRPPKGVPYKGMEFPMTEVPGDDKRSWLSWDGRRAHITDLDSYLLHHRRRMKPCTSFDTLGMDSGENQEFGTPAQDYMHFCGDIAAAIASLREQFPAEYAQYYEAYASAAADKALEARKYLINPMNFAGNGEVCDAASHYRIRVGACDADTAFTVSMALALKLQNAGKDVDYALVWDKPHCQADYPGEVCDWIEKICRE